MESKVSYFLTFYDHDGSFDRIKEYQSDEEARAAMNQYNMIDSGKYFSRIVLKKTVPQVPGSSIKIAELSLFNEE